MIDVEPLIASSFERIFPQPDVDADWDDVLHRAGVHSRRYLVGLAVVAALVLAPAAWAITQAFHGKPAPPSVSSAFQLWNDALGKQAPKAIVSKAHGVIQVQTADGPLDLWAAPARDGGTCYLVGWQSDLNERHAPGFGSCFQAKPPTYSHNLAFSWGGDHAHRNYEVVEGYAYGPAKTIRLTLTDGYGTKLTKTLPVVEHLFLGAFRRSRKSLQSGHGIHVVSITSRNAHGRIVGYWSHPAP